MAGFRVHRSEARRYTAMAQVGAGMLLAGAVAAYAFLPVAGQVEPPPAKAAPPDLAEHTPVGPGIDFESTAIAMKTWDAATAQPDHPKGPVGEQEPPKPPIAGNEWKYLGAIREATRMLAIVEAEGSQHMVSAGTVLDNIKVLEVRPDAIVVSEGAGKKTIELAPRQGAILGTASETEGGVVGHVEPGENEGEGDSGGIDPRSIERRIPKRPNVPGSKNMPRPPRVAPGANPTRPQQRPSAPGT